MYYREKKKRKKTFVCTVFATLTAWLSPRYAFNFLVRSVYKSHNRKTEEKDGKREKKRDREGGGIISICAVVLCATFTWKLKRISLSQLRRKFQRFKANMDIIKIKEIINIINTNS